MKRRIWGSVIVLVAVLGMLSLAACNRSPTATSPPQSQPAQPIKWEMATSWPDNIALYTAGAQAICNRVSRLSGGRLIIEPYPAGALVGAFDVFNAVGAGKVECGHGWPD